MLMGTITINEHTFKVGVSHSVVTSVKDDEGVYELRMNSQVSILSDSKDQLCDLLRCLEDDNKIVTIALLGENQWI